MKQFQLKKVLCNHLQKTLQSPTKQIAIAEPARLPWLWFVELSASRSYHGAGPNPISYLEIEAYARLMNLPLQPHHIDLICALDEAYIAHFAANVSNGNSGGKAIPATPEHAISPDLSDAIFG